MPLRPLPFRKVKRKLEAAGFNQVVQRGSHVKFAKKLGDETFVVIVPNHKEVSTGTLRSILRQAGLSVDDFQML